jgi:hypothetical protein
MKQYQFIGQFDESIIFTRLLTQYPHWIQQNGVSIIVPVSIIYKNDLLTLQVPDDAEDATINQIIDQYDPSSHVPVYPDQVLQAKRDFLNLPEWATWTAQEATDAIQAKVLTGQTKAQIDAWVDGNVTNIASARTALKLLAGAIIDLRTILMVMAKMLILLRDIVIRMRI